MCLSYVIYCIPLLFTLCHHVARGNSTPVSLMWQTGPSRIYTINHSYNNIICFNLTTGFVKKMWAFYPRNRSSQRRYEICNASSHNTETLWYQTGYIKARLQTFCCWGQNIVANTWDDLGTGGDRASAAMTCHTIAADAPAPTVTRLSAAMRKVNYLHHPYVKKW